MPNFKDIYSNKSVLSIEQLAPYYTNIITLLKEISPTEEVFQMQQNIHSLLFTLLMESDFKETMLVIADETTNQIISGYSETLSPDSLLVLSGCPEKNMFLDLFFPFVEEMRAQLPGNYTLMLLPYLTDDTATQLLLLQLRPYLAKDAKVILYDTPATFSLPCEYKQAGSYPYTESSTLLVAEFTTPAVLPDCYKVMKKSLVTFLSSITEDTLRNQTFLSSLIKEAQILETYATNHYDFLRIATLKNDLNDLKNTLLDLLFCDSQDVNYFINEVQTKKKQLFY